MRRVVKVLGSVAGIVLVSLAGMACAGDDDSQADEAGGTATEAGNELTVLLTNWAVEPSQAKVAAGTVRITAMHEMADHGSMSEGGATHQLLVAPLPDGAEPGNNSFGAPIVLNIPDLKPGESQTEEVELEPGRYELACLVLEEMDSMDSLNHYEKGMFAVLVVE
jgi:uncharacterized cupredoxin-like copper-binding protein